MRTVHSSKYKKVFGVLLKSKGYLGPKLGSVDSSVYPYLIGKREENCFYDLNESVVGIKQLFEVLENMVINRGNIMLIGGSISLVSVLLCLSFQPESNLKIVPCKFSRISQTDFQDFLIVHEVDKKMVLEAFGEMLPLSCAYYPTIKGISYPIGINLECGRLINWYSWGVAASFRRGMYRRLYSYYEI